MQHFTLANSLDLTSWASTRDAQGRLPILVRRLILSTDSSVSAIEFRSEEGVSLAGYDGLTESGEGTAFVPKGVSVWELGTDSDVKGKADDDYQSRTSNPGLVDSSSSVFVFVTPRRWSNKARWAASKSREGNWREVRAYDADDLHAWLETSPTVHLQFSSWVGRYQHEILPLESFWEEWSTATEPPMKSELMTLGRAESVARLSSHLRSGGGVQTLQGETREEGIAFLVATINQLEPLERDSFMSRAVLIESPALARQVSVSAQPVLCIYVGSDRSIVPILARNGHLVVVPLGRDETPSRDSIVLPKARRTELDTYFQSQGLDAASSRRYARYARRGVMALRREIALDPSLFSPQWSKLEEAGPLISLVLAGAWSDTNEADQAIVGALCRQPYADLQQTFVRRSNEEDPALSFVGGVWRFTAHQNAFELLSRHLTSSDLERLHSACLEVFGQKDPQFELPAKDRAMAGIYGKLLPHSSELRENMANTLAQLGSCSLTMPLSTRPGSHWARIIVRDVLSRAKTWQDWASISQILPTFAEAAPEEFLDALDAGLANQEQEFAQLFQDADLGFFGSSPHTGLLWALECLCWSAKLLPRASLLLAQLTECDPGGSLANRPLNSLKEIFLAWYPSTEANLERRLACLDLIIDRHPALSQNLLLGILPGHHGVSSDTYKPRWQSWGREEKRISHGELFRSTSEIASRLIIQAGLSAQRWMELVPRIDDFPDNEFEEAIKMLLSIDLSLCEKSDVESLHLVVKEVIGRHSACIEQSWAMPSSRIERLIEVRDHFTTDDLLSRCKWQFQRFVDPSLVGTRAEWEKANETLAELRRESVAMLISEGGIDRILEVATIVECPEHLGHSLAEVGLGDSQDLRFAEMTLGSEVEPHRACGMSFTSEVARTQGTDFTDKVRHLDGVSKSLAAIGNLYLCMPFSEVTWNLLEEEQDHVEQLYWSEVRVTGRGPLEGVDHNRVLRELLSQGRALTAMTYLTMYQRSQGEFNHELAIEILELIRNSKSVEKIGGTHDAWMIVEILKRLDNVEGLPTERLIPFEWFFLPLLDNHDRPPRVLHHALASDPAFFIEVLSWVFRAKNEEVGESTDEKVRLAKVGYRLLSTWEAIPGVNGDHFDEESLKKWVEKARELAREVDRSDIADDQIGHVLAFAPEDSDGVWPHCAVRRIIESVRSEKMEIALLVSKRNGRGVVMRAIGEGGGQERSLEAKYRGMSVAIDHTYPRTSRLLARLADDYARDALREDVEAALEDDW